MCQGMFCFLCQAVEGIRDIVFFFRAEDGIRSLVRSRGLGDVYKRQPGPRGPRAQGFVGTEALWAPDGRGPRGGPKDP